MCGIHGIISSDTYITRADDFMKDAFVAGQLRGVHSSGLFVVNKDGSIITHKQAVCGQDFIKEDSTKSVLTRVGAAKIAIGHVRHATVGDKTDENAHPFLIEREDGSALIGVHNGTLRDWKNKKNSKDVDVDSAWAFQMLADEGYDAFEYFNGAFAFVWYDSRTPDNIYMCRNAERPLHYMVTKGSKSILLASELGMLGWLAERNKIDPHEKPEERFRFLKPGHIYKFDLKNPANFTESEAPKYNPSTTIPPVVNVRHAQRSNFNNLHPHQRGYHGNLNTAMLEDDDDQLPFGMYPTRENAGVIDRYDNQQTELVLNGVRSALLHAKNERQQSEEESENEETEGTALDNWEGDLVAEVAEFIRNNCRPQIEADPAFDDTRFLSEPNVAKATDSEIADIKQQQLLGAVVDFTGILYDPETGVLYGTTKVFRKIKWYEVEAELRGVTGAWAHHKYINAMKPVQVCVVGYNPNIGSGNDPYYVVEELTERQRNLLAMFEQEDKRKAN